ncbi:MAG TPA: DUF4013 domain-containing protein [Roseiflexaceae bacterium]|nr:DUF4013 domain-containing protein [Roseiflexaceae bacterium]
MDIGKAFGFVFEDEEWVSKVLIGGLIFLIPLIGQLAVIGYSLKVAQNVIQGNPRPLPAWSEFGDHIMRGLYAFVIQFVYSLPAVILAGIFACTVVSASAAASQRSEGAGAGIGLLGTCLIPLIVVVGLLSALLSYPAIGRYLSTNSLSEAFKFSDVIANVRADLAPWFILLVVGILAGFVGSLGAIACGVGVLFTSFYAQCVIGYALGQTIVQVGATAQPPIPPSYGPPPTYQ